MPKRVLAITYLNAHKGLYYASLDFCRLLADKGYEAEVVDAAGPDGIPHLLNRLMTEEFEFCFGVQGVGSNLAVGGAKIWSLRRVPFICIHYDTPSSNIFNHANDSPYVANLYCFESMLDVHRRYIKTRQIVDYMPFQANSIPEVGPEFPERPIRLLFIKSGENLDKCTATLNSLPPSLRAAVWQQIEQACRYPNLQLCDLVQEIFDQGRSELPKDFDLFWGLVHWMDIYLRRKRAIDFVNWLKFQENALIVGDDWDFIDKTGARAQFRPNMTAGDIYRLYGESQFVCNTNPYGRDIIHERPVIGLLRGAYAISDHNAWWTGHIADIPAMKLFDWNLPLEDQLQPVIDNIEAAEQAASTAREAALRHFTGQPQTDKILAIVNTVRQFAQAAAV